MKCLAGIEFPNGEPCPKCNALLGEVCWPGINAELLEVVRLREENEQLRIALAATPAPMDVRKILNDHFYTGEPGQHEAIEAALIALRSPSGTAGAMREALEAALHYLDNSDSPGGCNGKHPECGHCAAIAKVKAAIALVTRPLHSPTENKG